MKEQENQAEYVYSHVEADMKMNEKINGSKYPAVFGKLVNHFLHYAANIGYLEELAVTGLDVLERHILSQTAQKIKFFESRKCAYAINSLWEENNQSELNGIREYAEGLVAKTNPEDQRVERAAEKIL